MATTTVTTLDAAPDCTQLYIDPSTKGRKSSPGKQSPKLKLLNTNKSKTDHLRALEPARKKLCMLESQRIIAVFEDTIKRAEIVTLLPYVLENLDNFNVAFGSELMALLTSHKQTEQSYLEIREQLNGMKRSPSAESSMSIRSQQELSVDNVNENDDDEDREKKEDEKEIEKDKTDESKGKPKSEDKITESKAGRETEDGTEEERTDEKLDTVVSHQIHKVSSVTSPVDMVMKQLSLVAEQLSLSCKNVLRAFAGNPAAIKVVLADRKERTGICDDFCVNLGELRDILMNKLLMTPIEAKEKMDYMEQIALHERQNATVIAKLETDLNSNNSEKDEEIKKRNDIIRKLQANLHQIERMSDENIRRIKTDSEKQRDVDVKNSEARLQKLKNDITHHSTQLQTLTDEHKEMESNMRKKKFKVETEVENWIQKYDVDMGERQDEYEEIDAIYTEEKKQLHELEERFQTLEEEYNKILELRRKEREAKEQAEREMHIKIRCATTIQAFWRSFKVRKMLKAKKKGKKGKKKK